MALSTQINKNYLDKYISMCLDCHGLEDYFFFGPDSMSTIEGEKAAAADGDSSEMPSAMCFISKFPTGGLLR